MTWRGLHAGLGGVPHLDFPDGHGNIGAAHGVSAVIALLAYAPAARPRHPHDPGRSGRAGD